MQPIFLRRAEISQKILLIPLMTIPDIGQYIRAIFIRLMRQIHVHEDVSNILYNLYQKTIKITFEPHVILLLGHPILISAYDELLEHKCNNDFTIFINFHNNDIIYRINKCPCGNIIGELTQIAYTSNYERAHEIITILSTNNAEIRYMNRR